MVAMTGRSATVLQARIAAVASWGNIMVSTANRSTPPSARASACSRNVWKYSSSVGSPSGSYSAGSPLGGATERVGLDDVAAGVDIPLVDRADDVGVGVVPQLRTGAVGETGREEHGAVAAVEDQRLALADALEDLPAAGLHRATSTPSSSLARTTASVESLA